MASIRFTLESETETRALAEAVAPGLAAGDTLLLEGQIGAGKTFFARALIQARLRAAGHCEDVPSPTFTLVQTYDDGICEIWHADLYRVSGPDELVELGLDDAFADAICLIEWPDRLGDATPPDAVMLTFAIGRADTEREVIVTGPDDRIARIAQHKGVALAE